MAAKPTDEALQVLKECTVEGNVVKLPARQLERDLYTEVKKHLELIGGKWKGGKTQGFVFENCEPEYIIGLLEEQANGEGRNLKKEFQFFATPGPLATRMAELASHHGYISPKAKILEPSAGAKIKGDDFLAWPNDENYSQYIGTYDVIVANPPFTGNQDIDHIMAMYKLCKTNGRIVTLASMSWTFGSQKKQVEFRDWLKKIDAFQEELPPSTFKESGTQVGAMLLVIDKLEVEIDNTPRFSDEELNEFEKITSDRIESAKKELTYLQGLMSQKIEGDPEKDQLAQLEKRQENFISLLTQALERIKNKTYGICRVTGKLIEKDRLRAVPHATLSISGKKSLKEKGDTTVELETQPEESKLFSPVIPDPITIIGQPSLTKTKSMKKIIVIPTSPFVAVLKKVKEVVDKNPILSLLDNILIKVRRSDIQIIATDLIVTVIADIDVTNDGDRGYEFLLPFKFLYDTMMLTNDNAVTIELIERTKKEKGKNITFQTAALTTLTGTYNLDSLDGMNDWPALPEFPKENSIGIADGFIEWLNLMLSTVSVDKLRPAMQGIYISVANNGITMASTNAHVIVEKTFACESTQCVELLISPKIAKALKGFKETSISWSETHVAFVSSNMTLLGRIQDEKFPNYRGVFPDPQNNLTLSLNELTGVMQKVSLTEKDAVIWLKKEIGRVVVESHDTDHNRKITERIGADYYGDCEKIVIIPAELLRLLNQVKYMTLSLSITGINQAVIITTESDSSYRSLIMPQQV